MSHNNINQHQMETQMNGQNTFESELSSRCSSSMSHSEMIDGGQRFSTNQSVFQTGVQISSNGSGPQHSRHSQDSGQQRISEGLGTYVGRNQYRFKVEQLNQKSQARIQEKRNKKRQNVIQQKRQIIFDECQKYENLLNQKEFRHIIPAETEQISSKITIDQAFQNKSQIFLICSKIKNANMGVQFEGIEELKDYLTDKSKKKRIMTTDVFEIIETGITRILLRFLSNSTDLLFRKKITQIFINLTLGEKREVQKLINSGLIEVLGEQIHGNQDRIHIINCVWSLSNISLTHLDMRNYIIKQLPQIFKMLQGYVVHEVPSIIPKNFYRLQSEIVYFVASMTRQEKITVNHFVFHYSIGIEILARCLKNFNFSNLDHFIQIGHQTVLTEQVNQFLFDIISTFCVINDTELLQATDQTKIVAQQQLDQVINQLNLFEQIVRVVIHSTDHLLLEKTWQLIGQICCCNFTEHNVRNFFKDTNSESLIKLIHVSLNSQKLTPKIMKNCIFTLSNIIADKHIFLEQILQNNLILVLKKLWSYVLDEQITKYQQNNPSNPKKDETFENILLIKNEIIYCIGNCVLAISDTMLVYGLELLKMAVDQGAFQILAQALDYKTYKTDTIGIKVALDGLNSYFNTFKKASKSKEPEICDGFHNYFEELTLLFEIEFNGLDALENCQNHQDHQIYKMSQKILEKYFELDQGNDQLTQLIDKLSKQNSQTQMNKIKCNNKDSNIMFL